MSTLSERAPTYQAEEHVAAPLLRDPPPPPGYIEALAGSRVLEDLAALAPGSATHEGGDVDDDSAGAVLADLAHESLSTKSFSSASSKTAPLLTTNTGVP